jgi:hypothetical protein
MDAYGAFGQVNMDTDDRTENEWKDGPLTDCPDSSTLESRNRDR